MPKDWPDVNDELSQIISRQFSSTTDDKLADAKRLLNQNKGSQAYQLTAHARLVSGDAPFQHDYVLYTAATPNGFKVSMLLEELEVPYDVIFLSFQKEEQKADTYLKMNPNGRIPTLLDRSRTDRHVSVWESAAILIYLCDKHESTLLPKDACSRSECISWIMWQMSGLGPMLGQLMYWQRIRAATGDVNEVAISRYATESLRLMGVMEDRLRTHPYLCGEHYTLADLACFSYAYSHWWAGLDIKALPNVRRWLDRVAARPATKQGLLVPTGARSGMHADQKLQKAVEENAKKEGRKYFGWPDLLAVMSRNKGNLKFPGDPNDLPIGPAGRL